MQIIFHFKLQARTFKIDEV